MPFFLSGGGRLTAAVIGLACLLGAAGCADTPRANFTISSARMGEAFRPSFSEAVVGRGGQGNDELEMVLVGQTAGEGGVRQIMHVRVLYRPMRAVRTDHPSATNATIHWYILGDNAADLLEYAGAGFVTVRFDDQTARVDLRNATLRPVAASGRLADSMGTISLNGSATAIRDSDELAKLLGELESRLAAAKKSKPASSRS